MLKKLIIFLILSSLISFTINTPADSFFKRKKSAKEQTKVQTGEQDKKVLLVQIFASWCPGCKNIQPTLDLLLKENSDIKLVLLDVSTPSKAKDSEKLAKELKMEDFYKANKSKTSTVAVIVPTSLEIVSVFQNNNDIDDYESAIDEAKAKEEELRNPPA